MNNTLELLSKNVLETLKKHDLSISTAESCTGGLIAQYLTSHSGASDIFLGGFVTYSNSSKINILGVKTKTIEIHGAVSKNTVLEMTQGAQNILKSDITIAVTGIAGPNGGTKEKPVGLVHHNILFTNNENYHIRHIHDGNRDEVRYKTAEMIFKMILKKVL